MAKRLAVIDREKCEPKKCGLLCIRVCPGVRMGDETIKEDEKGQPIIAEDLCTGCGLCVKKCPYEAISIINLPEETGEPTHRYNVNAFALYGFPAPQKGITGLIGRNGIGKSTLLKIMSGNLIPNRGEYQKTKEWKDVLEKFKGMEVYNYLTDLSKGKIKLAYKPQEVDKIPRAFKGTVSELLDKYDELGNKKDMITKLQLEKCLKTSVAKVSGGELQRAAIAVALMRKADYYFFDEPSSFLDIKQRIRVARIIRELADKNVFIVEHDLAVLDYLTDYVYVLYGKPGVYGTVSSLKNSRAGINEFLDGFLKAENTRIRDYSIRFDLKQPTSAWKGKKKYNYKGFEKTYPAFHLEADDCDLFRGEVVGIMGPNAIGKTTFMRILAGEETSDGGGAELNARISHKPQYISLDYVGLVGEYLAEQDMDRDFFESELRKNVSDLMFKNVSSLSGGELQRLSIATALARDCDICLLDEPSAFLDIEQRLSLAQTIKRLSEKKEITSMVIDHDVVFQDAVSNRIMVFTGESGKSGAAGKAKPMADGMNDFLAEMDVTFRRDKESGRPRVNKPGSQMDQEQKKNRQYYYTG